MCFNEIVRNFHYLISLIDFLSFPILNPFMGASSVVVVRDILLFLSFSPFKGGSDKSGDQVI